MGYFNAWNFQIGKEISISERMGQKPVLKIWNKSSRGHQILSLPHLLYAQHLQYIILVLTIKKKTWSQISNNIKRKTGQKNALGSVFLFKPMKSLKQVQLGAWRDNVPPKTTLKGFGAAMCLCILYRYVFGSAKEGARYHCRSALPWMSHMRGNL